MKESYISPSVEAVVFDISGVVLVTSPDYDAIESLGEIDEL